MGVIHIENVGERVLKALRVRAELNGRSIEDEIRDMISAETGEMMSPRERVDLFRRAQSMTPAVPQTDSTEIIRGLRDRGHAGR